MSSAGLTEKTSGLPKNPSSLGGEAAGNQWQGVIPNDHAESHQPLLAPRGCSLGSISYPHSLLGPHVGGDEVILSLHWALTALGGGVHKLHSRVAHNMSNPSLMCLLVGRLEAQVA